MKLAAALFGAVVIAAACAPASEPANIPLSIQGNLITQTIDYLNDAGRGVSVVLDQEGNPALSYFLTKAELKPGEIPPPIVADQPQPPAVVLATEAEGVWTRQTVTPQEAGKTPDEVASLLADDEGLAFPNVSTGLAVDAQGTHHVAWTVPSGLYYSNDAAGAFAEPEKVASGAAYGASVAVGTDGTVWIAYYAGGGLHPMVVHGEGRKWVGEALSTSAGAGAPATASPDGMTTGIRVAPGGEAVVAFGESRSTRVGTSRAGGGWRVEAVPGPGGVGVSLAVDGDGNPHVAYYDQGGGVHEAHSVGGGRWEVADLGTTSPDPKEGTAGWSTGIAVDDQGSRYVTWADTAADKVLYANDSGGALAPQPLNGAAGGTNPAVTVSADGKSLALAWYDRDNANVDVATTPEPGLAIAHPTTPPTPASPGTSPTGPAPQCQPGGTTIDVVAPVGAAASGFEEDCYAAPADKPVTIRFDNQDTGVPHNFEIFEDSSAQDRLGGAQGPADIIVGPNQATYRVDPLKPGNYYFHCDVHPTTMTGAFVVAG